jgi:hypothetical protein
MKFSKEILLGSVIGCSLLLGACDKNENEQPATNRKNLQQSPLKKKPNFCLT